MPQKTNEKLTFDVSILQNNVVGLNQYSSSGVGETGDAITLTLVIDGSTYTTDASVG